MFLGVKTDFFDAFLSWGVEIWVDRDAADDPDLRSHVGLSRDTAGTLYFWIKGGKMDEKVPK